MGDKKMQKTTAGAENLHRSIDGSVDESPTEEFLGILMIVGIIGLLSLFVWGVFK